VVSASATERSSFPSISLAAGTHKTYRVACYDWTFSRRETADANILSTSTYLYSTSTASLLLSRRARHCGNSQQTRGGADKGALPHRNSGTAPITLRQMGSQRGRADLWKTAVRTP